MLVMEITQVSEIAERAYASQELPKQSMLGAGVTLAQMLLRNPGALKNFMVMSADEERHVRPPREYELPAFHESMKHCTSNEPYLRPTRYCNPGEPEVIAMANELGAYELSDYEFAEAAYWFVKANMLVEMCPFDSVSATLKRGTGTCYHLTSVWIALCRAAGIKARYKAINIKYPEDVTGMQTPELQIFNTGSTPEAEGEVYVDGEWVVGHVVSRPELVAYTGAPITKFGEDAIGPLLILAGTIKRFESIPLWIGIAVGGFSRLAPATVERLNTYIANEVLPKGRKIIAEAGGREAYDQKARERRLSPPTVDAKEDTALVFEA
jgi:hypothetical protein